MDKLSLYRKHFRLEGEDVIRLSTGKPLVQKPARKGYAQASFVADGKTNTVRLHVLKFALHHGYIPPVVDHENRNFRDDRLDNLRAADHWLNGANADKRRSLKGMPRGVRKMASGRFSAYGAKRGRQVYLGSYDTMEAAYTVARRYREERYGEF